MPIEDVNRCAQTPMVNPRSQLFEALELIALSSQQQLTSSQLIELCKLWFDDIYVPSKSYFDALKGDYWDVHAENFISCFSEDELELLARFHRFFELRIEILRKEDDTLKTIADSTHWKHIVKDAKNTLALFRNV